MQGGQVIVVLMMPKLIRKTENVTGSINECMTAENCGWVHRLTQPPISLASVASVEKWAKLGMGRKITAKRYAQRAPP